VSLATFSQQYRQRIDDLLAHQIDALPDLSPRLKDAMRYALVLGGKRVRPFLVYATGTMLGAELTRLDLPAAAIECIHAYSLIHDDLPAMDNDDLRRGHPTVHKAFDEATAILAGDSLQTLAFSILTQHPFPETLLSRQLEMVQLLARAAGYQGMCGGQALDLAAEGQRVSLAELETIHLHKTGALIECAVLMGAFCAPVCNNEIKDALHRYARAIGLAFQVQDDILDVTADTETLGKPQGSDQIRDKSTYPALMGLEAARQFASQLHQQALAAIEPLPYNTEILSTFADYIIERSY
jgi:farnesyl diphosphate synthase